MWIDSHFLSNAAKGFASKLAPRRDGPYLILRKRGPASYEVADPDNPTVPLGVYHASNITPFMGDDQTTPDPVNKLRKRGRPKKEKPRGQFVSNQSSSVDRLTTSAGSSSRRLRNQRGRL